MSKEFSVDSSENIVQDVISKLTFISKIKEGEVVDVSSMSLMNRNSISTKTYRTVVRLGSESRDVTYNFFETTINSAFDLMWRYFDKDDEFCRDIAKLIMDTLQECKVGIQEHAKTYSDDRMHISKIETLLKTIDTKTTDIVRNSKRKK